MRGEVELHVKQMSIWDQNTNLLVIPLVELITLASVGVVRKQV